MTLLEIIKIDLHAHKNEYSINRNHKKSTSSITLALINPSFALVFWYRIYNYLYSSNITFVKRLGILLYYICYRKFGCDIHPASTIGVPFKVGHCSDIVIGPNVILGHNCYIFNGVTLGNKHLGGDNSMPKVGNDVILSTGSKILGGVIIETGAVIGALSVVLTDVPPFSTVVGIPGKVVSTTAYTSRN
jgi:serine O-acetyltransferase